MGEDGDLGFERDLTPCVENVDNSAGKPARVNNRVSVPRCSEMIRLYSIIARRISESDGLSCFQFYLGHHVRGNSAHQTDSCTG